MAKKQYVIYNRKDVTMGDLADELARWPDLSAYVKSVIENMESFGADRCCAKAEGRDFGLIITIQKRKKHEY